VTLFTERDIPHMRPIANVMRLSGCPVAPWLLNIKQVRLRRLLLGEGTLLMFVVIAAR